MADELRPRAHHRRDVLGERRDADQPGTDAQCGLAGEAHRPGHPGSTADDEHAAELAFVRHAPPARQRSREIGLAEPLQARLERGFLGNPDLQIVEGEASAQLRALAEEQPGLERHEADRRIRAHRCAQDRAAVGVEARGQVQCQHRPPAGVHRGDDLHDPRAHRLGQAGAKQCVDDHLGLGEPRRIEGQHAPAARDEVIAGAARIAAETRGRHGGQHPCVEPGGLRKARQHVAIAAVVAAAGDHDDAQRPRPAAAQRAQRGLAGALHQRIARHTAGYGARVEGANLLDGIQLRGQ